MSLRSKHKTVASAMAGFCPMNFLRPAVIFPNLVINDGSSVTVRTFYPEGAHKMHVTAWALGPVEESAGARARRLDAFLTFYGPGGFATPDDVEALELVQQGLANWQDDRWSEMSRARRSYSTVSWRSLPSMRMANIWANSSATDRRSKLGQRGA